MEITNMSDLTVINDSYNANPESMRAAIKTLVHLSQERGGVSWAFLGKMQELGAGALVGRPDWMRTGEPLVKGGGAVRFVTLDEVAWLEPPERLEAGTPNVAGAVALGAACRELLGLDMHRVLEHDLAPSTDDGLTAFACELVLEALVARRRLSRSDVGQYARAAREEGRRRRGNPEEM